MSLLCVVVLALALLRAQACTPDDNYILQEGGVTYIFYTSAVNRACAVNTCRDSHSGNLASIHSQQETSFIIDTFRDKGKQGDIWIGLQADSTCNQCGGGGVSTACDQCRRSWYWEDETRMLYNSWSDTEPNGDDTCGKMNSNGQWIDTNCETSHVFVCKTNGYIPNFPNESTPPHIVTNPTADTCEDVPGDVPGTTQTCDEFLGARTTSYNCYTEANQQACCVTCEVHRLNNAHIADCEYGDKHQGCAGLSLFGCYSNEVTCCQSCYDSVLNIPNCPYGDRASGCNVNSCPSYSEDTRALLCCQTCYEELSTAVGSSTATIAVITTDTAEQDSTTRDVTVDGTEPQASQSGPVATDKPGGNDSLLVPVAIAAICVVFGLVVIIVVIVCVIRRPGRKPLSTPTVAEDTGGLENDTYNTIPDDGKFGDYTNSEYIYPVATPEKDTDGYMALQKGDVGHVVSDYLELNDLTQSQSIGKKSTRHGSQGSEPQHD